MIYGLRFVKRREQVGQDLSLGGQPNYQSRPKPISVTCYPIEYKEVKILQMKIKIMKYKDPIAAVILGDRGGNECVETYEWVDVPLVEEE